MRRQRQQQFVPKRAAGGGTKGGARGSGRGREAVGLSEGQRGDREGHSSTTVA